MPWPTPPIIARRSTICDYPELTVHTGSADPTGYDLVVNATPLGKNQGDPLPVDVSLVASTTYVGEVVMKTAVTPFLRAARERGLSDPGRCRHDVSPLVSWLYNCLVLGSAT